MRPALIVLVEDPAGGVPGLTDDPRVADTLLARTLELARAVGGVGRVLLFSPPEAEGALTSRALGFRLWPAEGDSTGRRYANAFRQAGELVPDGTGGVAVLGLQGAEPTLFPSDGRVPDHEILCTRARQQRVRLHELEPHPALTPAGLDDYLAVAAAG